MKRSTFALGLVCLVTAATGSAQTSGGRVRVLHASAPAVDVLVDAISQQEDEFIFRSKVDMLHLAA